MTDILCVLQSHDDSLRSSTSGDEFAPDVSTNVLVAVTYAPPSEVGVKLFRRRESWTGAHIVGRGTQLYDAT